MRICHEVVLSMLKLLSIPSLSFSIGASTSFFRATVSMQYRTAPRISIVVSSVQKSGPKLTPSITPGATSKRGKSYLDESYRSRSSSRTSLCQGHPSEDICPAMNQTQLALFSVSETDLLNKLSRRGAISWNKSLWAATSDQHPPRPRPWDTLRPIAGPLLEPRTFCCYCLYFTLVDAPSNDSYPDYTLLRKLHLVSYSLETWLRGCELQCYCYLTFSRLLITLGPTGIFRQVCRIRQESLPPIQSKWPESWYRRHHLL